MHPSVRPLWAKRWSSPPRAWNRLGRRPEREATLAGEALDRVGGPCQPRAAIDARLPVPAFLRDSLRFEHGVDHPGELSGTHGFPGDHPADAESLHPVAQVELLAHHWPDDLRNASRERQRNRTDSSMVYDQGRASEEFPEWGIRNVGNVRRQRSGNLIRVWGHQEPRTIQDLACFHGGCEERLLLTRDAAGSEH